jgi:hypothetical protein
MAEDSLYNLPYKRSVSTNDKADIISARLHELKIAITIMQRHPNVLNEFVCAVKGGVNLPATELTAHEIAHYYRRDETHQRRKAEIIG